MHILVQKKCAFDSGKCVFEIVIGGGWPCKTGASTGAAIGGDFCAGAVKFSDEREAGKLSGHIVTGYCIL